MKAKIAREAKIPLAIHGGPKAVTEPAPANWLHGPNEIGDEEIQAVTKVLRGQKLFRFALDREHSCVAQFEQRFAAVTGAQHALAVNSGTSALIAGLVGLGVGQGDEVLVPAYTYIATAAAVLAVGAFPVLVELDASLSICPEDMERKITDRTRAVIPVHMRGTPCRITTIMEIARRREILVLEDVAQSNGALFEGKALGTFGDAGVFSLQHYKVMTAGEGGVLITNDRKIYERAAIHHDSAYAFWMEAQRVGPEATAAWKKMSFLGENYRMSELHGAIALTQLQKRDRILTRTRQIKATLWSACEAIPGAEMAPVNDRKGDCGISLAFFMPDQAQAVRLSDILNAEGVRCGTLFSQAIPQRHVFRHWDYIMDKSSAHRSGFPWSFEQSPPHVSYSRDMCPGAIALLERVILLPITQIMSDRYVAQLVQAIEKVGRGVLSD